MKKCQTDLGPTRSSGLACLYDSRLSHFTLPALRDEDERLAPGIGQSLNLALLPFGESHLDLTL
jgi:hypothetical protein